MRLTLRAQLALATLGLVFFSLLAVGALVQDQLRAALGEEVQQRGLAIARHLSGISGDFLLSGDKLALANFTQGARENNDVVYVKIVDAKGVVRAASPASGVEGLFFPAAGLETLSKQDRLIQRYYNGRQWIQDLMVPILVDGHPVGMVDLGLDESVIDAAVDRSQSHLLWVALGVLGVAWGMALLMAWWLARPVEQLTHAVRQLGTGSLDTRVKASGPLELRRLEESFNQMASRIESLVQGSIQSLANALAEHDQVSPGHAERVARLSSRTARVLKMSVKQIEEVRLASQLIDIGHMGVPTALLHKVDPLTDDELRRLRNHAQVGVRIVEPITVLRPVVISLLMHHHERFDGRGYPLGLRGEAIPLGARILAVADSFDAMLTEKRHRKARSQTDAMRELERCAGHQFDPKVVEAFITQLTAAS
jgi:HAMP domain-containing protein